MNVLSGDNKCDPKVLAWKKSTANDDDLFVSEMAVGHLLSWVRQRGRFSEDERDDWLLLLGTKVPIEFGGRYLRVSREAIDDWSRFRFEAAEGEEALPTVTGLDLAVARLNKLTYVAPSCATLCMHHKHIFDPWI